MDNPASVLTYREYLVIGVSLRKRLQQSNLSTDEYLEVEALILKIRELRQNYFAQ